MAMHRRKGKRGSSFLEKGILAIVIGCGFLAAPFLLGPSPVLRPVAQGLKTPAWIAIGLGLLLLAAHHFIQRKNACGVSPSPGEQPARRPGSVDMLPADIPPAPGDLRHDRAERSSVRPTAAPFAAPDPRQTQWSQRVFNDIEWRRFEAVCERLFAQSGFETRSQSHGADGGVDIWLYSKNSEGPAAVVQCKHWVGKPVGVKEVREFFGVMTSKGLKRGTFAATSGFTASAIEFAKENGINLLDGDRLLALIDRRSEPQKQELLAVAYEGEYWRPTCASCGVKLVQRTSTKDGSHFWGCANFPKCRTRMSASSV